MGLKLREAGEWLFEEHGTSKRRSWRKFHIGIDADSDEIVAFDLTDKDVDDASHVEPLLEQLDDAPASFMGDGAYDRSHVLDTVLAKNPTVKFIVPPCKGAMLGSTATTAPTQRNLHIRSINEHGRRNWQKASGYNRRLGKTGTGMPESSTDRPWSTISWTSRTTSMARTVRGKNTVEPTRAVTKMGKSFFAKLLRVFRRKRS